MWYYQALMGEKTFLISIKCMEETDSLKQSNLYSNDIDEQEG